MGPFASDPNPIAAVYYKVLSDSSAVETQLVCVSIGMCMMAFRLVGKTSIITIVT